MKFLESGGKSAPVCGETNQGRSFAGQANDADALVGFRARQMVWINPDCRDAVPALDQSPTKYLRESADTSVWSGGILATDITNVQGSQGWWVALFFKIPSENRHLARVE